MIFLSKENSISMRYKPYSCKWCGKNFQNLLPEQEATFCFCSPEHKEEYEAWRRNHEARAAEGEFNKLPIFLHNR